MTTNRLLDLIGIAVALIFSWLLAISILGGCATAPRLNPERPGLMWVKQ